MGTRPEIYPMLIAMITEMQNVSDKSTHNCPLLHAVHDDGKKSDAILSKSAITKSDESPIAEVTANVFN